MSDDKQENNIDGNIENEGSKEIKNDLESVDFTFYKGGLINRYMTK